MEVVNNGDEDNGKVVADGGSNNSNGGVVVDIEKQDGDGDFKTVDLTTATTTTEEQPIKHVVKKEGGVVDFEEVSDNTNTNTNGLCYRCEKRDFVWSNVNMTLLKTKKGGVTEENTKLKILDNVWGKAQAGKTTAIMGASGAGSKLHKVKKNPKRKIITIVVSSKKN